MHARIYRLALRYYNNGIAPTVNCMICLAAYRQWWIYITGNHCIGPWSRPTSANSFCLGLSIYDTVPITLIEYSSYSLTFINMNTGLISVRTTNQLTSKLILIWAICPSVAYAYVSVLKLWPCIMHQAWPALVTHAYCTVCLTYHKYINIGYNSVTQIQDQISKKIQNLWKQANASIFFPIILC